MLTTHSSRNIIRRVCVGFLVGRIAAASATQDTSLAEKLMGKWVLDAKDDAPILTNSKIAYNYVSASKAYLSASLDANPDLGTLWGDLLEAEVAVRGNKVTVTYHPGPNTTAVHDFSVSSINDSEFSAYAAVTVTTNGEVVVSERGPVRFKRVHAEYGDLYTASFSMTRVAHLGE